MLPAQDVAAVQAATARYRAALAKIEADDEAGRATLINRLRRWPAQPRPTTTATSAAEESNRKRMAEVGAVYDATPAAHAVADIMPSSDAERDPATAGPTAANKWLTVSVEQSTSTVIASIFDEAVHRDPRHQRTWVVLVEGNGHQLDRIAAEACAREVTVSVVVDFVHVLGYLWKAAWCFFREADPAAEAWVAAKAREALRGHATAVAGAIRRTATNPP
jgi:hypothetical protein